MGREIDLDLVWYADEVLTWSLPRLRAEARRLAKARRGWRRVIAVYGVGADQVELADTMLAIVNEQAGKLVRHQQPAQV